jgi:hypothetical protein
LQHKFDTIPAFYVKKKEEPILDTQRIVAELKAERNRLDRAITALDGANTGGTTPTTTEPSRNDASSPRKHHMTVAGRKRLSVLMKKRWAEKRKKNSSGRKG